MSGQFKKNEFYKIISYKHPRYRYKQNPNTFHEKHLAGLLHYKVMKDNYEIKKSLIKRIFRMAL